MTSLISSELGKLLALRRVHRGYVSLIGRDLFLDHGRRVPGYLHTFLRGKHAGVPNDGVIKWRHVEAPRIEPVR